MTTPSEPVPTLPPRFADASFVAKGGTSTVYRARTTDDARIVAVKVFHTDGKRFSQEVEAAARLVHVEGVVQVLDAGRLDDGRRFLVTDFFALGTVADQLESGRQFTVDEVCQLGARLGATLDEVHRCDVVHGDVKPSNVLIDHEGRPWLTDFGTARAVGDSDPDGPTLTFTILYSAPEVLDGAAVGPASDQYALGLLLATLLLGEHPLLPFAAAGIGRLVDRIRDGVVPDLSLLNIPAPVAGAVMRACSTEPAARFADCAAFADALRP